MFPPGAATNPASGAPSGAELCVLALSYTSQLETATLDRAHARSEMEHLARAVKALQAALAMVGARLAEMGNKAHAAQVAKDLAQLSGVRNGEVAGALAAATALRVTPELDEAARQGLLSGTQLGLVAKGAQADTASVPSLIDLATKGSLADLCHAVNQVGMAVSGEARRRRWHERRYLRSWSDDEGWHLAARGTCEDGLVIMGAIRCMADKEFDAARQQGRREGEGAYAFDGLKALALTGGVGQSQVKIRASVRIDHDAIIRGQALPGETCEIVGIGPTTPQGFAELLQTHDPFIVALVTKGEEVSSVVHLGRHPKAKQRSALDWIYPVCAAQGCGRSSSWLQTDHRQDWSLTHYTTLHLLDRLCPHHHRLKTHMGWRLVPGIGVRPFVPPDDRRHPRYTQTGTPIADGLSYPPDVDGLLSNENSVPTTEEDGGPRGSPRAGAAVERCPTPSANRPEDPGARAGHRAFLRDHPARAKEIAAWWRVNGDQKISRPSRASRRPDGVPTHQAPQADA